MLTFSINSFHCTLLTFDHYLHIHIQTLNVYFVHYEMYMKSSVYIQQRLKMLANSKYMFMVLVSTFT